MKVATVSRNLSYFVVAGHGDTGAIAPIQRRARADSR
jgi:hypothetical protein